MAESTITFLDPRRRRWSCSCGTGSRSRSSPSGSSLSLWATGVLDLDEALGGFGDPTVIYIAALFVVSEALDATGVTAWVGQQLVERAGNAPIAVVGLVMVVCALVTALISVNGAVAALVPVVVVIAIRVRCRPRSC